MKRVSLLIVITCLLLMSCNVEVRNNSPTTTTSLPNGCFAYLTYSASKVSSTTTDSYSWVRVGVEDPDNNGWEMYSYNVYVSLNSETWTITSGESFSVPRNTTTFYLKVITHSLCNKDGNVFNCTSISVYKNGEKQSETCYVQAN